VGLYVKEKSNAMFGRIYLKVQQGKHLMSTTSTPYGR
jgi:hypothetical protein